MSFFATVVRIVKRIALTIMVIVLSIGVLAFIFIGDSEKETNTVQISSSSNAVPGKNTDKSTVLTKDIKLTSEEAKVARDKFRASRIQSIRDANLVLKDASLCLVVGEWALYKADDSAYGLTKPDIEIADALAKKGQDWIKNFVSNVGENSYLHQAYLESKYENTKKCESNAGFSSCWIKCLNAFK
jgi:hypothetical protein